MSIVETASQQLLQVLGHFDPRLGLTVLTVLAGWLLRRILVRTVEHRNPDPAAQYRWRKITAYVAFFVILAFLCLIWGEQFRSLGTFLGLVSAGIAISLKDLVMGAAGWMFILVRHPFGVGDRIQVGRHRGDVIDIRLFKFTLMEIGNWVDADQSTGRVVHIPNGAALSEVLVNYTRGFDYLWNEIPVLVTFESDWKRGKKILLELVNEVTGDLAVEARKALEKATHRYFLSYRTLTPTVYTSIRDGDVLLTIRHLTPPRRRRGTTEALCEGILERFEKEENIELAYPTQRLFAPALEAQPGPGVAKGPWNPLYDGPRD